MSDLARQQCFYHPGREAVVRCPGCRRDYCRECVTEHDDRYLCTSCLRLQAAGAVRTPRRVRLPVGALLAAAGLLSAWTVYYSIAQYLAMRGASAHTNRVWHTR